MAPTEPAEPPKPFLVGYARVSTDDQDNARQREELIRYGVDGRDIHKDHASGRTMDRYHKRKRMEDSSRGP